MWEDEQAPCVVSMGYLRIQQADDWARGGVKGAFEADVWVWSARLSDMTSAITGPAHLP